MRTFTKREDLITAVQYKDTDESREEMLKTFKGDISFTCKLVDYYDNDKVKTHWILNFNVDVDCYEDLRKDDYLVQDISKGFPKYTIIQKEIFERMYKEHINE